MLPITPYQMMHRDTQTVRTFRINVLNRVENEKPHALHGVLSFMQINFA